MSEKVPEIRSLYRLPFSKNDNPNGWVEITTFCNQKCPNCYRGCDREDMPQAHESLEKIFSDIDELVRLRNCQIISISGGEPLLHPGLTEVVRYVSGRKLSPWLQTNALALSDGTLRELKHAGLEGLVIRVDSLQNPGNAKSEIDLNDRRVELARLVKQVGGLHLSFIAVISRKNLQGIPDIIDWARQNAGLVDFLAFIPMRQVRFREGDVVDSTDWVYLEDLCRAVGVRFPELKYASYLGSQNEAGAIKWLQSIWAVMDGRVLGYGGPKVVELFQTLHHLRKGTYAYKYGRGRSRISVPAILAISLLVRDVRPIASRCLKAALKNPLSLFGGAFIQTLCYIIPPGLKDRRLDLCDGCPDAMLYQGRLVPSCGLEEVKLER